MDKETIAGDDFRAMLSEFTEIPAENLQLVAEEAAPLAGMAFTVDQQ